MDQGLKMDDQISLLSARALAELDLARSNSDPEAARIHLAEAERHLDMMRELCRGGPSPAVARLA